MTTIASDQVSGQLPHLLKQVAGGEKVLITEGGKPVAMLVPPPSPEDVRKVIEAFKAYSKQQGRTLEGLSVREMIEEGRR